MSFSPLFKRIDDVLEHTLDVARETDECLLDELEQRLVFSPDDGFIVDLGLTLAAIDDDDLTRVSRWAPTGVLVDAILTFLEGKVTQ